MAQFPLLCAHWQLSFMPCNWATTFVLSSLAVPLRCISPAVGWKWLGRLLDLQERCAANHSYHTIQQHLLGWPVLVVVLKPSAHPVICVSPSDSRWGVTPPESPKCFKLCLSHQGDGKIQAIKAGGGGGPDQLCAPQARIAATGLEQILRRRRIGEEPLENPVLRLAVTYLGQRTLLSSPWPENTEIWRSLHPKDRTGTPLWRSWSICWRVRKWCLLKVRRMLRL